MILKLVLRNLRRHPFLNLIKLAGLMLAFSSMMLIAFLLSAIPLTIQNWKAARRNPVEALRYE